MKGEKLLAGNNKTMIYPKVNHKKRCNVNILKLHHKIVSSVVLKFIIYLYMFKNFKPTLILLNTCLELANLFFRNKNC